MLIRGDNIWRSVCVRVIVKRWRPAGRHFKPLNPACTCVSEDHAHAAISHSSARLPPPILKCQNDVPWTRREDTTAGCSPAAWVCTRWDAFHRVCVSTAFLWFSGIKTSRISEERGHQAHQSDAKCCRQWPLTHQIRNRCLVKQKLMSLCKWAFVSLDASGVSL